NCSSAASSRRPTPARRYSGSTTMPHTHGDRSRIASISNSCSWTVPTARPSSTATNPAEVGRCSRLCCVASRSQRGRSSSGGEGLLVVETDGLASPVDAAVQDVTARLLAERFDGARVWCDTTGRVEYAGGQAADPPAPGSDPPAWYS